MKSLAALITIVVLGTALAGCGSDGGSSDSEVAWQPDSSVPTEPGADGFTQPDAVLSLGDTAAVPYFDDGFADEPDTTGELEVTVSERPVEKSPEDVPSDGVAPEHEGTPWFVTFTVTNTGDAPISADVLIRLTGVDVTGESLDSYASSSAVPGCVGATGSGLAPGATEELCSVVFAEDEDLAAVGYESAEEYDDHPVLWDVTSE